MNFQGKGQITRKPHLGLVNTSQQVKIWNVFWAHFPIFFTFLTYRKTISV